MGDAYMQEREPTTEEIAAHLKAQEDRRRRAIICLAHEDVARMLHVPEGIHIVGIWYEWRTQQLEVGLQGDQFDVVPDGMEAPRIDKRLEFVQCNFGDLHILLDFPEDNSE